MLTSPRTNEATCSNKQMHNKVDQRMKTMSNILSH